jgi:hypothetical protein
MTMVDDGTITDRKTLPCAYRRLLGGRQESLLSAKQRDDFLDCTLVMQAQRGILSSRARSKQCMSL